MVRGGARVYNAVLTLKADFFLLLLMSSNSLAKRYSSLPPACHRTPRKTQLAVRIQGGLLPLPDSVMT